jgi:hypothetical protein
MVTGPKADAGATISYGPRSDAASRPHLQKENMIDMQEEVIPNRVTVSDMQAKVKASTYTRLPDSTTTVCQITLENGYTLVGTSACVDPASFNQAMGEKIAYDNAFEQLWALEGYLLKQRRFEAGLS